jgi:hypothetical protein
MLFPGQCLEPSEIDMLARVCRTVCDEHGLSLNSREAEWTGSRLLTLFMNGLKREEELLDAERNRARVLRPGSRGYGSRRGAVQAMPESAPA